MTYNITEFLNPADLISMGNQATNGVLTTAILAGIFFVVSGALIKNDRSIGEAVTFGGLIASILGTFFYVLGGVNSGTITIFWAITAVGTLILMFRGE